MKVFNNSPGLPLHKVAFPIVQLVNTFQLFHFQYFIKNEAVGRQEQLDSLQFSEALIMFPRGYTYPQRLGARERTELPLY